MATVLVFASCKKPENNIGTDLLPDGQELGNSVIDTVSINAYTLNGDSISTRRLVRNMLGSYLDRDLGVVKATIASQLLLSANNVGDGLDVQKLVLDSIVLAMEFTDLDYGYGNLDPQIFRVYELDTLLSEDSVYYNINVPPHKGVDLVRYKENAITPRPLSFAYVGSDTLQPQIRIPLDNELGKRFLSRFGEAELASSQSFLDYFNGIYIDVDEQGLLPYQRGILHLDLLDGDSKVTMYYRDTTAGAQAALEFDFVINSSAVRYTVTQFDHSQAITSGLYQSLDLQDGSQYCYLQAGGGLMTVVQTPYFEDFKDADLSALNKVELIIPNDPAYSPFYRPSSDLDIARKDDDDDALKSVIDQSGIYAGDNGDFDEENNEYRFNLTLYFQGVLNGDFPNNGLYLVPANNSITVNRTILQGPKHPLRPMRMELTFTEY